MLLALRFVSRSGLLAGLTLPIVSPLWKLVLSRMLGVFPGKNLGLYLLMQFLLLGMRFPGLVWMIFGPSGARVLRLVYFGAYCRAGGSTAAGNSAFIGRGLLRIRRRRLGGRAVGGRGSSRLFRVSHGDEVDVHCAQYFVTLPLLRCSS